MYRQRREGKRREERKKGTLKRNVAGVTIGVCSRRSDTENLHVTTMEDDFDEDFDDVADDSGESVADASGAGASANAKSRAEERAAQLGFTPQKEVMHNRLLPYAGKEMDRESAAWFARIKGNLARAVALGDVRPGFVTWSSRLNK